MNKISKSWKPKMINKAAARGKSLTAAVCLGTFLAAAGNTGLAQQNFEPAALEDMAQLEKRGERREFLGFFGGAVIGGLLAGPPGVIVAASLGLIGSILENSEDEKQALAGNLSLTRTELYALQAQQRDMERKYQLALEEIEQSNFVQASLNQVSEPALNAELSLHFKTNSSTIEQHYEEDLAKLAGLVSEIPGTVIEISGYADQRGPSAENLALSRQRVRAVENKLKSLGVTANVIRGNAYGESNLVSQAASVEDHFFDRRVMLRLRTADNELVGLND